MFVFDLLNFGLGAVVGIVVAVLVPKVFASASSDIAKVEAAAKKTEATVVADVKSAANTVATKL